MAFDVPDARCKRSKKSSGEAFYFLGAHFVVVLGFLPVPSCCAPGVEAVPPVTLLDVFNGVTSLIAASEFDRFGFLADIADISFPPGLLVCMLLVALNALCFEKLLQAFSLALGILLAMLFPVFLKKLYDKFMRLVRPLAIFLKQEMGERPFKAESTVLK